MVWNRYEVSDVESQYLYAEYSILLRVLGRVWHLGILCPLAAIGVTLTLRQWRRLWVYYLLIASMACSVALFYVMARYRFPLVPLLIPFAAAGCVHGWRALRGGEHRRLLAPAAVAVVVAIVVNLPVHDERRLNAMAYMNLGVALAEEGDLGGAADYFQRAAQDHPQSAEAHNNLAQALALQGDHADAIPHYEAALALEPMLLGVEYNLGVALEGVGRLEEALKHYERAVEIDPSDVEARQAVGRLRGRE
jgi:tetratricopeptide (TPR) repeat protein